MTSPDMDDEAMKVLARRIVDNLDFTSMRPVTAYDAAYAAIIETRDRDAALVERMIPKPAGGMFSHTNSMRVVLTDAAAAIRSGQQFRKDV